MPRTIAIGDIHGCSVALAAVIGAIRPENDDTVVTLGDYVDRGPDTRGAIELLIDLKRRCRLVPIFGNHDEMMLKARHSRGVLVDWLSFGGQEALDSYGSTGWSDVPAPHFAFLESCVPWFETDSHIFTHGNYDARLPMAEQEASRLRWTSLKTSVPGPHVSGKKVIVGHSAQASFEVLNLGHVVCIDTKCYGGGWLTAMDVATGELWQANGRGEMRRRGGSEEQKDSPRRHGGTEKREERE